MTREELFKKYSIDESHNAWEPAVDNWYSVEVYRAMHEGKLPPSDDNSVGYITDFLDKCHAEPDFMTSHKNWGSLYLTAKRMVYSLQHEILKTIN